MHELIAGHLAVQQTRGLARSALPDAPIRRPVSPRRRGTIVPLGNWPTPRRPLAPTESAHRSLLAQRLHRPAAPSGHFPQLRKDSKGVVVSIARLDRMAESKPERTVLKKPLQVPSVWVLGYLGT